MAKSKKPTGLTLTRDKRKFTCGWKCGTKDYDDGQDAIFTEHYQILVYDSHRNLVPKWLTNDANLNPSKSDTSKSYSITLSDYYPSTTAFLNKVSFKVRGNRDKKSGMKSDPTWSDWSTKSFDIDPPYEPVLTEALDQSEDRTTIFSWSSVLSDSNSHMFVDYEWESVRVLNGSAPYWDAPELRHTANGIDPDTGGSDTGSQIVHDNSYSWNINKDGGSVVIAEDSAQVYSNSHPNNTWTRFFRVRARGPAGASDWVYAYHVYGRPPVITEYKDSSGNKPSLTQTTGNSALMVRVAWAAYQSYAGKGNSRYQLRPIDYVQLQYCIQSPAITVATSGNEYKSTLSFNPNEVQWTNAPGGVIRDSKGFDSYSFSLDTSIPDNKMMFVRATAVHDRITTTGNIVEVENSKSYLTAPSGMVINDVDGEQHRISITKPQNNSGIPNSFTAIYYRSSSNAGDERVVGIVPWGQESGTMIIQCPEWKETDSPGLGMKTLVADYSPITSGSSALVDNYKVSNFKMESNGIVWLAGSIPIPPRLSVDKFADSPYDTIEADWDWRWNEANGVELSWADHKDAWNSTKEPSRYTVSGIHANRWHISELEPKTWHVRCRLLRETSEGTNFGAYSSTQSVTLSTNPTQPAISTDTPTITFGSNVTVYWQYYNEDGTKPESAELGYAAIAANGDITYPDSGFLSAIPKTTYDQKETLNTSELGWTVGSTYYIVVRVISSTGQRSAWSMPVAINVIAPVTASISGTLINTKILTELPFTVNVSGIGTDGIAAATITRKDSYSIVRPELRPDEAPEDGFEGETIATASRTGAGAITFTKDMLIGRLDDGANYEIVGTVVDSHGQSASTDPVEFTVAWSHQAIMPEATITIDNDHLAAIITPTAVQGAVSGDTVDIYRLSADRPELIVKGATMGATYVDPYPTLGRFGGHRLAYITKDGDYITEDNTLAIENYPDEDFEETSGYVNYFGAVIDFGSEQIRLPYNIELSNKWSKDFTEVKYLGGSVNGYWNKAVSRTSSIKTSVVIEEDEVGPDTMRALRRLAVWPGVCHVRTPDGSSYAANINVSEDYENKLVRRLASVTLEVTRVDSQGEDGMTYEEWERNL